MQVSTNINALISSNALSKSNASIADSVQRLSTGQKLAKDDPSSIGMGSRLKAQLGSLSVVNKGLNLGIGALQQMDSGLTEVQNILQNMYQLAISSSADDSVISTADRTANSTAFVAYAAQLTALSKMPKLGTIQLLSSASTITMKANDSTDNITAATYSMANLTSLASTITTAALGTSEAAKVKTDIDTVSGYQAQVGANLESLTSQISANSAVMTGITSAYSTVTSSDMASEVSKLASAQIRQSAASAMFAQSNQMDREVVSYLLKGLN
jgi:flagellin